MKFSRDAAIPRIPAPHLLKQGQLQLAGASFRDLAQLSHRCCKWPWIAVEPFNLLLRSCCKMSVPILWYYDMFRLVLARHGCRTMLRDEAAKDPRTILFPRRIAIPGWKNIDQPPYIYIYMSLSLLALPRLSILFELIYLVAPFTFVYIIVCRQQRFFWSVSKQTQSRLESIISCPLDQGRSSPAQVRLWELIVWFLYAIAAWWQCSLHWSVSGMSMYVGALFVRKHCSVKQTHRSTQKSRVRWIHCMFLYEWQRTPTLPTANLTARTVTLMQGDAAWGMLGGLKLGTWTLAAHLWSFRGSFAKCHWCFPGEAAEAVTFADICTARQSSCRSLPHCQGCAYSGC